ncbi:CLUMA_CG018809, isoform A [Clunio marinus]|uniref:CLUMA_CG018809, isoform A n=1 Tax=Clunio marinus TaxID=568069 RepID=A0A1J1IZZ7_9DIPT|nr:CLUMA_CG018809, isoform A [Clunio marinus]
MDQKVTILVAPLLKNSSCENANSSTFLSNLGALDVIQAFFIMTLTLAIVGANLVVIIVINCRRYASFIHPQPRYLITSLALNDLAIGLLITPFGTIPALLHCWPYGEIFCQIQALLRGALAQQSAVILVCMAVDRYTCALYPQKYHQHSSKKLLSVISWLNPLKIHYVQHFSLINIFQGCVAILSVTWILCLTFYGVLVLPKGYYYNATGLLACEPFFSKPSYRILASCAFYFPTTMVLMYCYGSSFHANRFRLASSASSSFATPAAITEKMVEHERVLRGSTSRTMAAISLGFIVIVTPYTIQEVVAACTGSKIPPSIDFAVTWFALSNGFWNPFLYWLLNAHFRSISHDMITSKCFRRKPGTGKDFKSHCCSLSLECDHEIPLPPLPKMSSTSRPSTITGNSHGATFNDFDGLSEKYWGEILERTFSSNSLHALQHHHQHQQKQQHQQHNHNHHMMHNDKHHFSNNTAFSDINLNRSETNLYYSNSEPHLECEHDLHDINCAKNKAFFGAFNKNEDI